MQKYFNRSAQKCLKQGNFTSHISVVKLAGIGERVGLHRWNTKGSEMKQITSQREERHTSQDRVGAWSDCGVGSDHIGIRYALLFCID